MNQIVICEYQGLKKYIPVSLLDIDNSLSKNNMDLSPPFTHYEDTNQLSSSERNLTFKDFIPYPRGDSYESFGVLVERANIWLEKNPTYEVKTCESIEIFHYQSEECMSYYVPYRNFLAQHYMRGLRLWLVSRKESDKELLPQKIGYYNLIPNIIESRKFRFDKFEKLNQLLERFNKSVSAIIHGRIITIETQQIKVPFSSGFDPDQPVWSSGGRNKTRFIFIIRIFFEYGVPTGEEIGVTDFVPDVKSEGGFCCQPKFENFSNAIQQASEWCAMQHDIRFCNIQSLEIKLKNNHYIDPQKMSYTEGECVPTIFVRILRVCYTKCLEKLHSPSSLQLACKTIIPYKIVAGIESDYETLSQVKERLQKWIRLTGATILSAETSLIRLKPGVTEEQGVEVSRTYSSTGGMETWIFVFRLYLNGDYIEPPTDMLPPPPTPVDDCCTIS